MCVQIYAEQGKPPDTGPCAILSTPSLEDWVKSSRDSGFLLSQKGRESIQFRNVIKAIERYRGRPLDTEEVAREFVRIMSSFQSEFKTQQDPERSTSWPAKQISSLGEISASIENNHLNFAGKDSRVEVALSSDIIHAAENTIKKISKLSGKAPALISGILWYIWVESCLNILDSPFNYYIYSNQLAAYNAISDGKTFGPGVMPSVQGNRVIAKMVFDPLLSQVGVIEGTELLAFDGQPFDPKGSSVIDKWFSPEPYSFTLTFWNGKSERTVKADTIPFRHPTISWSRLKEAVYIRVSKFSRESMLELRRLFRILRQNPPEGLLIDLRANRGGVENFGIVDFFFRPGQTIGAYKRFPDGKLEKVPASVEYYDFPTVLLIDGRSASMSEVFAAAFSVHKRGLIVGEKTFGKGVGQTCSPVDEEGMICLVHTKYFYPDTEKTWDGVGISPDIPIEATEENRIAVDRCFDVPVLDIEHQLKVDVVLQKALHVLMENNK